MEAWLTENRRGALLSGPAVVAPSDHDWLEGAGRCAYLVRLIDDAVQHGGALGIHRSVSHTDLQRVALRLP